MLTNYLKIAWRNLLRKPLFGLLNVGGLAVGMAVSLLMLLFVAHESSYDHFRQQADRIVRVWARFKFGDQTIQTTALSAQVGPALKQALPGVEAFVRVDENQRPTIRSDYNHVFNEPHFWLADTSFFRVFDIRLLAGDAQSALMRPGTVVLSQSRARKYFGEQPPMGKHLTYNGKLLFTVTGIMPDPPSNSSLQADFVAGLENLCQIEQLTQRKIDDETPCSLAFDGISLGSLTTYFLVDNSQVSQQIPLTIRQLTKAAGTTGMDGTGDSYFVQPFTDLHLGANSSDTAKTRLVTVFLILGVLVLALALVNYMNLTTAGASVRAKEIGVRKASGAARSSIAYQFYLEAALTTLLAFGGACLLAWLLKPAFLNLLQVRIDDAFWQQPRMVSQVLLLVGLCIGLAGSYPAIMLSAFSPVAVLKGRLRFGSGLWVRRGLTIFQFSASTALIICALVIHQQVSYWRTKSTGLQKAQVIGLEFGPSMAHSVGVYQQQIKSIAGVDSLAISNAPLFKEGASTFFVRSPVNQTEVGLEVLMTNAVFFDYFRMSWQTPPADWARLGSPRTVVLNETAAKQLGYSAHHLGPRLSIDGGTDQAYEVIGIVNDFTSNAPQFAPKPLAIIASRDLTPGLVGAGGAFYVRLPSTTTIASTVDQLKHAYHRLDPETPFRYYFLDQAFAERYQSESRLGELFSVFVGIALLISCLGLFGLATFAAEQRIKEIGVRKVLGASLISLLSLLSWDFLKLVLVGVLVSCPIAWYAMQRWLADYAYKTELHWWLFAGAGLLAVSIALLTVSYQSLRAARLNPVKSLRTD